MEKRGHPRHELFAQVQLSRENEVYVMSTENISAGGLFVHGSPRDYPEMTVGTDVELLIFAAENLMVDVTCGARVIRVEHSLNGRSGFGLQFTDLDQRNRLRLSQFISDNQPPPLPAEPALRPAKR